MNNLFEYFNNIDNMSHAFLIGNVLFDDIEKAEKCAEILKKSGHFSAVCETVKESFIEL